MANSRQAYPRSGNLRSGALIGVLVIAALAALWIARLVATPERPVRLAPAWQLLDPQRYRALQMADPFVSWAPDSESLVLSVAHFDSERVDVMKWEVGGKRLEVMGAGSSPSFIDSDHILLLKGTPPRPVIRDLNSGTETATMRRAVASPEWSEVRSIEYDRERRAVITRLVEYTERHVKGTDIYDLEGNRLGQVKMDLYGPILEMAQQPDGRQTAAITAEGGRCVLRIGSEPAAGEPLLASPYLGAIEWSSDGRLLAVGDESSVVIVDPDSGRNMVVGRFAPPEGSPNEHHVSRVKWSPNGKYLAVLVYASGQRDYPLVNVLDLSEGVFVRK